MNFVKPIRDPEKLNIMMNHLGTNENDYILFYIGIGTGLNIRYATTSKRGCPICLKLNENKAIKTSLYKTHKIPCSSVWPKESK